MGLVLALVPGTARAHACLSSLSLYGWSGEIWAGYSPVLQLCGSLELERWAMAERGAGGLGVLRPGCSRVVQT